MQNNNNNASNKPTPTTQADKLERWKLIEASNALRAEVKDLRLRNEDLERRVGTSTRTCATQTRLHAVMKKPLEDSAQGNLVPEKETSLRIGGGADVPTRERAPVSLVAAAKMKPPKIRNYAVADDL